MEIVESTYRGKSYERPPNLPKGSQYICLDTKEFYVYGEDRIGTLVAGPRNSGLFFGTLDYNDLATQTTPISITGGGGFVKLTNDGLGPQTNKTYAPSGVTDVWNTTTNQFDGAQLSLGDVATVRAVIEVTTTFTFTDIVMNMSVAIGSGTPYSVHITQASYKDVGVYNLVGSIIVYMGNNNTLDYPAEIVLSSDKDITVKVIGWAITIHKY